MLIFCANKSDVDDIHEYLLRKGVSAVSIVRVYHARACSPPCKQHGDKDQDAREHAVRQYTARKADVLVATDVASKGLDFDQIKHVINFDMPQEIEDYGIIRVCGAVFTHLVHRIGRTGRSGKTGLATTYINRHSTDEILLDLLHLLKEAKQRIPPALAALDIQSVDEDGQVQECTFCSGLGHRITNCPKLQAQQRKNMQASMRSKEEGW